MSRCLTCCQPLPDINPFLLDVAKRVLPDGIGLYDFGGETYLAPNWDIYEASAPYHVAALMSLPISPESKYLSFKVHTYGEETFSLATVEDDIRRALERWAEAGSLEEGLKKKI